MNSEQDFHKTCFIIMPFGKKHLQIYNEMTEKTEDIEIDFDFVFNEIFKPAIESVSLPEGNKLIAKRADDGFFSTLIDTEMFELLEYSRLAFVDITGLNPNVFYELGVRHHARPNGTLIFQLSRLPSSAIPFDIKRVRTYPYEYDPIDEIIESKDTIKKVVLESLKFNKVDSPIQVALGKQKNNIHLQSTLVEAENALRNNDAAKALEKYYEVLRHDKTNILTLMKIGILHKENGNWEKALECFSNVNSLEPSYAEAFKEKGIAQNKLFNQNPKMYKDTGEKSLILATELNKHDFDAFSSLGGIYKRLGNLKKSCEMYLKAVELTNGNHYPLLNYVKLQSNILNESKIDLKTKLLLKRAKSTLTAQIKDSPPYNAPWSFFDLAEIDLFLEDDEERFLYLIEEGISYTSAKWQIKTFLDSLNLIKGIENKPQSLDKGVQLLEDAIKALY